MKSYVSDIEERPSRRSIRIYYQNVNSLKIGGRVEETETAMKVLKGAGVSIFCLGEVNKNFAHREVKNDMKNLLERTLPGTEYAVASNTGYKPEGKVKPGGVLTATRKHVNKYVRG